MIQLTHIQKIYFIGIGGIGMSALARYFLSKGTQVSGYDKTITALTETLEKEGINIHYTEDVNCIPKDVDIVVYTPAIPAAHAELTYYRENGYTVVKRSDVLQWITEHSFNICVAGTHGKTTVTSMIAHILRDAAYGCNAFLGGIAANYNTNFWSHERNVVVVEADEYDRSFLKLFPNIAVITSMDPDHLDIYGTAEEVENAFVQFAEKIKPGGCLITKLGLKRAGSLEAANLYTYDFNNENADVHVTNLSVSDGSYSFSIVGKGWVLDEMVLNMGGLHNIDNMLAAVTVAKHIVIDDNKIRKAVAGFKGVRRRFEYALKTNEHVLIDDYAHHPEELNALISGVKSLYPGKPITLVFQPHLFSRTKDQAEPFAKSLSKVDEVLLLPIYPARELPIEGVTSEMLLEKISLPASAKKVIEKEALLNWVAEKKPGLMVMAGAGDIDILVQSVKKILESN